MDGLIPIINQLQQTNNRYNITDLELPQIVVVGSQSSGKSSVLERIIGFDILPKAAKVATRCPIFLQLQHVESVHLEASFGDNIANYVGPDNIAKVLQEKTDAIGGSNQGITENPIILKLRGKTLPTLTLIDLPGMIKNDGVLETGTKDTISKLSESYASKKTSILLAISSANVDLSNSDAIFVSQANDPEGKRTLHVITKIDIMDRGTTVADILNDKMLSKSLGIICVVNRSQENVKNRLALSVTDQAEEEYIKSISTEIKGQHGIKHLVDTLVTRLKEAISKNIPEMKEVIAHRIDCLARELSTEMPDNKERVISSLLSKFKDEYKRLVRGDRERYPNELIGGAKISEIIYVNFVEEIKNCKASPSDKEKYLNLLKNTAGNRKMSYSIEKAFVSLITTEIEQFLEPSYKCNGRIKIHLNEFVELIIKECAIDKYSVLSSRINEEMTKLIDAKFAYSSMIIENVIRCERDDIFCLQPNTVMFDAIGGKINNKMDDVKKKIFSSIIDVATTALGYVLPPNLKLLLIVANSSGALQMLKEYISRLSADTHWNTLNKMPSIKLEPHIPSELIEMIKKVTTDNLEVKDIKDFLLKEKNFPDIISDIMSRTNKSEDSDDLDNNPNLMVLEELVGEYFEEVRSNVIRNIPKWIQTIFIKDLLEEIEDALFCIRQTENVETLLDINPEEADKMRRKQNELQELNEILESLSNIRRY